MNMERMSQVKELYCIWEKMSLGALSLHECESVHKYTNLRFDIIFWTFLPRHTIHSWKVIEEEHREVIVNLDRMLASKQNTFEYRARSINNSLTYRRHSLHGWHTTVSSMRTHHMGACEQIFEPVENVHLYASAYCRWNIWNNGSKSTVMTWRCRYCCRDDPYIQWHTYKAPQDFGGLSSSVACSSYRSVLTISILEHVSIGTTPNVIQALPHTLGKVRAHKPVVLIVTFQHSIT